MPQETVPVVVADPADPRVREYFNLTDVAMRRRREPEMGIFMAETSKVIRRAVEAGHRPLSFLMAEKWLDSHRDLFRRFPEAPVYTGTAETIKQLTGFHLHRGALAVMERPAPTPWIDLLEGARTVAVLEDIVDHTNVGALFRSAAALGVDAVLITPECADPLYRRSIRVSMGTVFQVPWARVDQWPEAADGLKERGWEVAALALDERAVSLQEFSARRPAKLALVLGTEGDGLGAATLARADHTVMIPMQGGVDSLNVAAASAVAFWELRDRTAVR